MATVCVRVQDSQKCLVPWTIFQTDDGITLSELLERMKAGRITVIVPSSDLVSSTIEKAFVGKSKESLVSIDHCIHLSDILSTFGQFIRYNVVRPVVAPVSSVCCRIQPHLLLLCIGRGL